MPQREYLGPTNWINPLILANMSAVLAILLALLGFNEVKEVPTEYMHQTKDGIIFIDPAIAKEYDASAYDRIKYDVYTIQEEAYPGGLGDLLGAG